MAKGSFDAGAFYAALNQTRGARGLTWKQVAEAAGVSASTLTRMAQGKRPDVDGLAALTSWSNLRADDFVIGTGEAGEKPETMAMISTYLRSDKNLSADAAQALESIIATSYQQLRSK
jgi:transcriptional regulator with XRE-family HTH domain